MASKVDWTCTPAQASEDGAACLEAALRYAGDLGLSVLPNCHPKHIGIRLVSKEHQTSKKPCASPGKRPWILWDNYQVKAANEAQIRRWWKQYAHSNVGAALGPASGFVRVDVEGEAGLAALARMSGGDMPPTLEFASGRLDNTGRGFLYQMPSGVVLATTSDRQGEKAEVRFQAQGSQTVLPPSRHPEGGFYCWLPGRAPGQIEPAIMPDWLVTAMLVKAEKNGRPHKNGRTIDDWRQLIGGVAEGGRNEALTALAGKMLAGVRDLTDGGTVSIQRVLLHNINQGNQPPLDEAEVDTIFHSILQREAARRRKEEAAVHDAAFHDRIVEQSIGANLQNGDTHGETSTNGNGCAAKEWDLIIVGKDPSDFLLKAPYWSSSPELKDGYLRCSEDLIVKWSGGKESIVHMAWCQTHTIVPPLKKWAVPGGHLDRLKDAATCLPAPPETQRTTYILGFVYRYLADAQPLNDSPCFPKNGKPTRREDGTIVFRLDHLKDRIAHQHESFGIQEVTKLLDDLGLTQERLRDMAQRRGRWWIASPENLKTIGLRSKEEVEGEDED